MHEQEEQMKNLNTLLILFHSIESFPVTSSFFYYRFQTVAILLKKEISTEELNFYLQFLEWHFQISLNSNRVTSNLAHEICVCVPKAWLDSKTYSASESIGSFGYFRRKKFKFGLRYVNHSSYLMCVHRILSQRQFIYA